MPTAWRRSTGRRAQFLVGQTPLVRVVPRVTDISSFPENFSLPLKCIQRTMPETVHNVGGAPDLTEMRSQALARRAAREAEARAAENLRQAQAAWERAEQRLESESAARTAPPPSSAAPASYGQLPGDTGDYAPYGQTSDRPRVPLPGPLTPGMLAAYSAEPEAATSSRYQTPMAQLPPQIPFTTPDSRYMTPAPEPPVYRAAPAPEPPAYRASPLQDLLAYRDLPAYRAAPAPEPPAYRAETGHEVPAHMAAPVYRETPPPSIPGIPGHQCICTVGR